MQYAELDPDKHIDCYLGNEDEEQSIYNLARALANEDRIKIIRLILKQPLNIYEIARKLFLAYDYTDPAEYIGQALLVDNIFNLVVKPKYHHSARGDDIVCALYSLKTECLSYKGSLSLAPSKNIFLKNMKN